jgi:hypothetical protein
VVSDEEVAQKKEEAKTDRVQPSLPEDNSNGGKL